MQTIDNKHLFRAISAGGGVAAVLWFATTLGAVAAKACRPREGYWVLRGQKRDGYICARPGCPRFTALCVFDSERAAREHLGGLSESQMFLDALEFYGASLPCWVREEPLLPRIREVSAGELGRIIQMSGVPYVALNPPPSGEQAKTFELWHAGSFLSSRRRDVRTRA